MTVVIAQHFFQGLIVVADSRSSKLKNGSWIPWRDNTQKIFFLTPSLIIAFSGDIEFAGTIISFVQRQIKIRPQIGLLHRFIDKGPKLIRYGYQYLAKKHEARPVGFIVAGIDFSRASPLKDEKGNLIGRLPIYDKRIIKLVSPEFNLERATLENPFLIMGSGEIGVKGLEESLTDLQFGQMLNSLDFQAMLIEILLREKIKFLGIDTVGGLSQIAIIDNNGPRFQNYKGKKDPDKDGDLDVEMVFQNGRFVQKDLKTGKEIVLLHPPEIIKIEEDDSELFAELNKAA
jgi:hypothetical protein